MQLTPRSFWFSLNQTGWVKLSDALTGSSLNLPRGNTIRFLLAFFNGDIRRADKFAGDLSNIASCTLVLRKSNETGAPLYVRTLPLANFKNPACTYEDWSAQRDWQAEFVLTPLETNWAPAEDWDEKIWVAVEVTLADGSEVTLGHGTLTLVDPGIDTTDPVTENVNLKASQEEAESGDNNTKWMTPLRTFQAIAAWVSANLSLPWSAITGTPSTFPPAAHNHEISDVTGLDTALGGKQDAGDYAPLVNGLVPAGVLPSYVDDVLEYDSFELLPEVGESGKIYITPSGLDDGKWIQWRWSGSAYVQLVASPGSTDAVLEGSFNKYFTPERAADAAPVQEAPMDGIPRARIDGSWVPIESGNPFDQSLNTTDSVSFKSLAASGIRVEDPLLGVPGGYVEITPGRLSVYKDDLMGGAPPMDIFMGDHEDSLCLGTNKVKAYADGSMRLLGDLSAATLSATNVLATRKHLGILDLQDFGWVSDNIAGTNYSGGTNAVYGGVNGQYKDVILGSTSATAGGSFCRSLRIWKAGSTASSVNFAQSGLLEFDLYVNSSEPTTANSICRIGLFSSPQANSTSGFQALSQGYGIEIRNTVVWLVAHNGTNSSSLNTGLSVVGSSAINTIRITRDFTGLYVTVNGTTSSKLTTYLPTATAATLTGGVGAFQFAATNGATAADARFWFHRKLKALFGF